ncbi:alpha/beta fold hydrolase [Kitasatospora sp. NPDC054939]
MQNPTPHPPRTLVLGATGFLGRWLVRELLAQGKPVAVGIRGGARPSATTPAGALGAPHTPGAPARPTRDAELRQWLREHGADDRNLTTVAADITRPGLGLSPADDDLLADVRDVYNLAALYSFGLGRAEAHAANADGALHALRWAATRTRLRRHIHLSGYRVTSTDGTHSTHGTHSTDASGTVGTADNTGGRTEPGGAPDVVPRYPLPAHEVDTLYARLGAYEASKTIGDSAVRVMAGRLGVPLTTVNPSSVIGHSETGEAAQYIGLADLVRQLWTGQLPLLPGSARTFLPVVAIDHLARFLAAVPEYDDGAVHMHTVLDPSTPELPALISMLADHLGVRPPRGTVPTAVVRRLPRALTGADPETLSFLSEDRYDTASADRLADAAGLRQTPVEALLTRWAERLVAERFGAGAGTTGGSGGNGGTGGSAGGNGGASALTATGRFAGIAGSRTFVAGDREQPSYVLLHGLPVDADSWHGVAERLGEPVLLADLPGLGRSSPARIGSTASSPITPSTASTPSTARTLQTPATPHTQATAAPFTPSTTDRWLAELLAPVRSKPVLVGHSAGTAPALRYAAAHPERVAGVVLVAPYFLQPRPGPLLRTPAVTAQLLRRAQPGKLADLLGVPADDPIVAGTAEQLRRPGVARRTAAWLRAGQQPAERAALATLLRTCPVPVLLVAGAADPLTTEGRDASPWPVTVLAGAGHYPQLSCPDELAATIAEFAASL